MDEPLDVGGDDKGPNPYEILLAALAGCTSMTLFMYAQRKGIPLDEVEITMKNSRIHADDCEHCEEEGMFIDEIERDIVLRGDLTEEQREKLAYIATRCPVHRTLTTPTHVHDTVA
jgi:putative redox protein